MSRQRKKNPTPAETLRAKPASASRPKINRARLWLFRVALIVLAPLLVFLLLETVLWLAGFGYPTAFLLPSTHEGRKTLVHNTRFGWRFYGRQMARTSMPLSFSQVKAPGAIRIFVLGESAAYGDPQPRFGLPRLIEAMLGLRHPGMKFEVLNVAVTAINSHVVLPIARDCARADGDIWVIYMGNNEVVGPFGAGTVFGAQTPPLPLIRATLALKTTRTGEWLDALRQRLLKPPPEKSEWGGMLMFLDQQIRADDPRMQRVYHHFEQNLSDIIRAGKRSGAGIVVSTVGVNLRECAPFSSAFRPGLSETQTAQWKQDYEQGVTAQAAGNNTAAAGWLARAAAIDDTVAELRFRQALCAEALGQAADAQRHFSAARDFDTLRFRCDSRLNELIRQHASNRESERILLADAERMFAEQSPGGVPGAEWFYEHVHLTFEGNYRLARVIVPQIETLLPESAAKNSAASDWPSISACAGRLGWTDWYRRKAWLEMLGRMTDAPFTHQLDHEAQVQRLTRLIETLAPAGRPEAIKETRAVCEAAIAGAPDDYCLNGELAMLKEMTGDLPGAEANARRAVQLLPTSSADWAYLGHLLAQKQQFEAAADAFRKAFRWDEQDVWALQNLAQALVKLGRREEALREYRHALEIKPRFGLAWLGMGQVLEETGRGAEAEECYHKAIANPIRRPAELRTLARFCQSRGWFAAAVTNYAIAIQLDPLDASLHIEAGQSLSALNRRDEAAPHYAQAARLAPGMMQAHFLYGLELGRQGKPGEAVEQFRDAVRLMPDLVEARLNLALALMNSGNTNEALKQFEEVLKRNPTDAIARRQVEMLQSRLHPAGTP